MDKNCPECWEAHGSAHRIACFAGFQLVLMTEHPALVRAVDFAGAEAIEAAFRSFHDAIERSWNGRDRERVIADRAHAVHLIVERIVARSQPDARPTVRTLTSSPTAP